MLHGVPPAIGAGAVKHQEAVMQETPREQAKVIHAATIKAVVSRLVQTDRELPPFAVPMVAANVAMGKVAQLLAEVDRSDRLAVMFALEILCESPVPAGGAQA
jgi:hypothetical protein